MALRKYVGIGIASSLVILSLGIVFFVIRGCVPKNVGESVAGVLAAWGQNKITVNITNDTLEAVPIAELSCSKTKVRSIIDYSSVAFGSTKRIIARQSFEARFGWDMNDDIKFQIDEERKSVVIKALRPRLLTLTHVELTPEILHRENGFWNKLTPEDQAEVSSRLELAARIAPETTAALDVARKSFEELMSRLIQTHGITVTFEWAN